LATPDARPDARNDAFIREVDDEYRRSQLESYWARYGRILAIVVVVLLVALAAGLYWREDRARRAGATGERFNLALTQIDTGNFTAAAPVLADLAKTGSPGYRATAQLEQAAVAVQSGDAVRGLALYRTLAADPVVAKPFRDLATIKATRLEYDSLPPATVIARLKPFAVPGDPWFAVAGEMTAIADLKLGQRDRAMPLLVAIVRDASAAPSIRNRAGQLAIGLGADPATLLGPQSRGMAQ
jgi:hypothetical protein